MRRRGLHVCVVFGACLATLPAAAQERLIAVDSSRALYEVNMSTGAKTQIGTVSANASTTEPAKLLALFVLDTSETEILFPDK